MTESEEAHPKHPRQRTEVDAMMNLMIRTEEVDAELEEEEAERSPEKGMNSKAL